MGAYTLIKEIQHSTFISLVGVEKFPYAKILGLVYLSTIAIIDGYLVDHLRRYQLLLYYSLFYFVIGCVFTLSFMYISQFSSNELGSNYESIGWIYFLYCEAFYPMLIGVFWAFMNSISTPSSSNRTYGMLVAFSKLGGGLCAVFGYLFLSYCLKHQIFENSFFQLGILSGLATLLLLFVPIILAISFGKNKFEFKGYNDVLKVIKKKTGVWSGLKEIVNKPYVLMILVLLLLTNALYEVISYQRLVQVTHDNSGFTTRAIALFWQVSQMHAVGFLISILGTNTIFRFLGARRSLFILPLVSLVLLLVYIITHNSMIIIYMYIICSALIYSMSIPAIETLYVVTNKDIQFKSKFLMDAYGLKLGRSLSHIFNSFYNYIGVVLGTIFAQIFLNTYLLFVIVSIIVLSAVVTKKYEKAVKEKIII